MITQTFEAEKSVVRIGSDCNELHYESLVLPDTSPDFRGSLDHTLNVFGHVFIPSYTTAKLERRINDKTREREPVYNKTSARFKAYGIDLFKANCVGISTGVLAYQTATLLGLV